MSGRYLNNDQFTRRQPPPRPPGSRPVEATAVREQGPTINRAAEEVYMAEAALEELMREPGSGADDATRAPSAVTQLADRHLKEDGR